MSSALFIHKNRKIRNTGRHLTKCCGTEIYALTNDSAIGHQTIEKTRERQTNKQKSREREKKGEIGCKLHHRTSFGIRHIVWSGRIVWMNAVRLFTKAIPSCELFFSFLCLEKWEPYWRRDAEYACMVPKCLWWMSAWGMPAATNGCASLQVCDTSTWTGHFFFYFSRSQWPFSFRPMCQSSPFFGLRLEYMTKEFAHNTCTCNGQTNWTLL